MTEARESRWADHAPYDLPEIQDAYGATEQREVVRSVVQY